MLTHCPSFHHQDTYMNFTHLSINKIAVSSKSKSKLQKCSSQKHIHVFIPYKLKIRLKNYKREDGCGKRIKGGYNYRHLFIDPLHPALAHIYNTWLYHSGAQSCVPSIQVTFPTLVTVTAWTNFLTYNDHWALIWPFPSPWVMNWSMTLSDVSICAERKENTEQLQLNDWASVQDPHGTTNVIIEEKQINSVEFNHITG